jgi:hypothetical protein
VALAGVLAIGAAVAVALVLGSGGGSGATTQSSATGAGSKTTAAKNGGGNGASGNVGVSGKMVPFTGAGGFTVDVPKGSKPTVTEESLSGGVILTVLLSPDGKTNVQVQQAPEEPPSVTASTAADLRSGEGATRVSSKPVTVGGHQAYLLQYVHDEPPKHNLPDMGQVAVANYLFNDSGSSWRTRAAVETSVNGAPKRALAIAKAMAESFETAG